MRGVGTSVNKENSPLIDADFVARMNADRARARKPRRHRRAEKSDGREEGRGNGGISFSPCPFVPLSQILFQCFDFTISQMGNKKPAKISVTKSAGICGLSEKRGQR